MAYNEKHREALAYGSNEATPWIEEEAEALGITPHEVAESILRAKRLWDCRCRRIESYRVSAKRDIRLADEIRGMGSVIGSLNTQIESLNSETK